MLKHGIRFKVEISSNHSTDKDDLLLYRLYATKYQILLDKHIMCNTVTYNIIVEIVITIFKKKLILVKNAHNKQKYTILFGSLLPELTMYLY